MKIGPFRLAPLGLAAAKLRVREVASVQIETGKMAASTSLCACGNKTSSWSVCAFARASAAERETINTANAKKWPAFLGVLLIWRSHNKGRAGHQLLGAELFLKGVCADV